MAFTGIRGPYDYRQQLSFNMTVPLCTPSRIAAPTSAVYRWARDYCDRQITGNFKIELPVEQGMVIEPEKGIA